MNRIFLLSLLFLLVGCSSTPKKVNKQVVIKKAPMVYDALCYSRTEKEYSLIEKLLIARVSDKGVVAKVNPKTEEEIIIKKSCILERKNIKYKIKGMEKKINFFCVMDYIGDTVFKGDEYLLMKSFYDGEYVILYSPSKRHEFLLNTENCQVLSSGLEKE